MKADQARETAFSEYDKTYQAERHTFAHEPSFMAGWNAALDAAARILHINYCPDLVEDGTPWEVPAEPEPQYFETFLEALEFYVEIIALKGERE